MAEDRLGTINQGINDEELEAYKKKLDQAVKILSDSFIGKILYKQNKDGSYKFDADKNLEERTTVTDISFDGYNCYVQDNLIDRYRLNDVNKDPRIKEGLPPLVVTVKEVDTLGKAISNLMGKTWTTSEPILDVEIGNLRTNFVNKTVSTYGTSFAIRVSRASLAIKNIETLCDADTAKFLDIAMKCKFNTMISGETGSGKTEFQKALVGFIPDRMKISLLEDTRDSHIKEIYPEKDINSWVTVKGPSDVNNGYAISFADLIRAGLRNNPDWLMISETRGSEANDVISAALTDHSIMTTLHATGASNIPSRIADMIATYNPNMNYFALQLNILSVINLGIHLERIVDPNTGHNVRRIREIYEYVDFKEGSGVIGYPIYQVKEIYDENTDRYVTTVSHFRISDKLLDRVKYAHLYKELPDVFKLGTYDHETFYDKKTKE